MMEILRTITTGILIAYVLVMIAVFSRVGGFQGFLIASAMISAAISLGIELERKWAKIKEKVQ